MLPILEPTVISRPVVQSAKPIVRQPESRRAVKPNIIPGVPPQSPVATGIEWPMPRSKPISRGERFVTVCLRRGFYPGVAWGEMLVQENFGTYNLVESWMPNFKNFRPYEVREVRIAESAGMYSYHIVEVVSDTVSGPMFRMRLLNGTIWHHWRKCVPGALPMYVDDAIQPNMALVTGVLFKMVSQRIAEIRRQNELAERERLQREHRRAHPHGRHNQRRN